MTTENNLKIRFRLPNGEEFEAEGSQEFIEYQRNYFLNLIGKGGGNNTSANPIPSAPAPVVVTPTVKEQQPLITNSESSLSPVRLWERILREEGNIVVFRKHPKISPQEAISVLLAGARILLQKQSCSALELSRACKLSAINLPGRLDRLLAGEIQQGLLSSMGTKRSRTYSLTESGFTKAFVLGEKLAHL